MRLPLLRRILLEIIVALTWIVWGLATVLFVLIPIYLAVTVP